MTTQEQIDMNLEIAALRAENARLKANKAPSASIKVSTKGAVSVYGLGRFPVTLYASQWQTLFSKQEDIAHFINNNTSLLAHKE